MILSEPGRTAYDWNFSILGFEIRVHPLFLILPLLIGYRMVPAEVNTGLGLLIIVSIFFVSILVHELGHALAFRYYGLPSRIVLYWMGGLAIPESGGGWSPKRSVSLNSNQQIVVSLAGPVFGLLLAALLAIIVYAAGGSISVIWGTVIPYPLPSLAGTILDGKPMIWMVFAIGILLNVFLNLLNLLPVYPLDGGQVARQVMIQMDGQHGIQNSIYLSMGVSLMLAAYFLFGLNDHFLAIFFAYMAWTSYQSLQQFQGPRW